MSWQEGKRTVDVGCTPSQKMYDSGLGHRDTRVALATVLWRVEGGTHVRDRLSITVQRVIMHP